jgi:hypothetical protein
MSSKDKVQEKAEAVLAELHDKIEKFKEKVDKLCNDTGCFEIKKKDKLSKEER